MSLAPGAVIGIVGGGQLGRMIALAAARLGYRCHILTPEQDSPAAQVTSLATIASYGEAAALERFAAAVDVVTMEFENLPVEALATLARTRSVHPAPLVLAICQDRRREKAFLSRIGAPVAPYVTLEGADALEGALAELGRPALLKTARLGYDGKGQVRIEAGTPLDEALASAAASPCVLESVVDFEREISVITARGRDGAQASYVPVENRHRDQILVQTIVPAPISVELADRARALAEQIAAGLELVGLLAVEMFVTRDGRLLVNELAPRPHNSGHWTIDACAVSQFEQLVRAVCGVPLGDPARFADAVMDNLLGADVERWRAILAEPGARLHLYGKGEIRAGRKLAHVTRLKRLS
jgi:5-(carboxyamino)imidazole ribonucleotide synthase